MNRYLHISQTLAKVAELVNELANEFNQLAHDPANETQISLFPSITEERPKPEPEPEPEPEITIDVVRSKLKDVAVKVSAPRAKQILSDAGATSVGELDKAKYAQVVAAAEEALS